MSTWQAVMVVGGVWLAVIAMVLCLFRINPRDDADEEEQPYYTRKGRRNAKDIDKVISVTRKVLRSSRFRV